MNYQTILERIHTELAPWIGQGRVADYIPELAKVPADKFGMAVVTLDGNVYTVGDAHERFSIRASRSCSRARSRFNCWATSCGNVSAASRPAPRSIRWS